ncbi:MAG TPA: VIT domain-containing protein [Burkholderiaceae bacterium]|nr:VIT domain-containing protein [Burkholderiaceae bacterium]
MRHTQCTTKEGDELILQGLKAQGRVVGRMLEMTLAQTYLNAEDRSVEVVYTFPLPHGAVLLGIEVTLNGESLHGKVTAKAAARECYEEALTEGHTALLLTASPNGMHTLELGNLLANETAVVRLTYAQVLKPEQGSLRLTLPTTLAPRYGDAVRQGGYEPHAVPESSTTVEYPFDLVMHIEGELAMARIGSPSHPIQLQLLPAVGANQARAQEVRLGRASWLDRDFILKFDNLVHPSQALAAWDLLEAGVAVVMASFTPNWPLPPSSPIALKVLVDCSGSMAGDSIQAARRALHKVVEELNDTDRFSLSRFGDRVEHRSKALWKVLPRTRSAAQMWVSQLSADLGGTEMAHALSSTLALSAQTQADLLLVTDGEVHAVDEVITTAKGSGQRVFVVGIGTSPAEGLLRRLAEETGGSCEFVAPGEEVEPAILRLYHRMRCPVVTQVRVEGPPGLEPFEQTETPKALFDGDNYNLYARYRTHTVDALMQTWVLWGVVEDEAEPRQLARVRPAFIADEHNTLARLAAHTRYTQLRRQATGAPQCLTQPLPELAEKYQLVTNDTSFVLVKERAPGEAAADMPELRQVKHMQAAGWGGRGSVLAARDNISVPSCWRRPSSGPSNQHAGRSLFDDFEIPAFLRRGSGAAAPAEDMPKLPKRSADNWIAFEPNGVLDLIRYEGWTPAGFAKWLQLNPALWPAAYDALREMGLGELVVQWLQLVIGAGEDEPTVVTAFNRVMAGAACPTELAQRIRHALGNIDPHHWPSSILYLDEDSDA